MKESIIKFDFDATVLMGDVEATLRLALLAAEALHGEDRVHLEARTRLDRAKRACLIDISTDVGRTLAAIFRAYVRCEFGADAVGARLPTARSDDFAGSAA